MAAGNIEFCWNSTKAVRQIVTAAGDGAAAAYFAQEYLASEAIRQLT